jgi:hypothetical protein
MLVSYQHDMYAIYKRNTMTLISSDHVSFCYEILALKSVGIPIFDLSIFTVGRRLGL